MLLLPVVVASGIILLAAYFTYGTLLARLFQLDSKVETPAVSMRDDLDYEPISASSLLPQHFSAIAAAGPIVGPILAGITFGWVPALIWILCGSILIGGVHDFAALVASVRHKAGSIAEVVRQHMSGLSYTLFLTFIWIALVYIIVAFTDVTASAFVAPANPEAGNAGGGAIATSSLLYLILPIAMGLCQRYFKMPLWLATVIFVPLVGAAIVVGPYIPFDVAELLSVTPKRAQKIWDVALLLYCLVAAVIPVWLLLQPRGHLGGYFLYIALAAGALGLMLGGMTIQYPAFRGFSVETKTGMVPLFPMLFVMIACGACSGFHSLIASGTTSKQLRCEPDAKPIGYGTMLLEAMVAIVSLCCVMMFPLEAAELKSGPNMVYAEGIGKFLDVASVPVLLGKSFALMAFTTFVYDTLDVCTRLGRYIIQELVGSHGWFGKTLGTVLTAGVPMYFLITYPEQTDVPIWRMFWDLFGASNQLLAALTLLGLTVWVWRTRQQAWAFVVLGLPTVWMYVMSSWALANMTIAKFQTNGQWTMSKDPVAWAGIVLLALALVMLGEGIRVLLKAVGPLPPSGKPAMVGAGS